MTPNRFDGRDSTSWWADLPPRIRERFTPAIEVGEDEEPEAPADSWPIRLAGRFGAMFLLIALANGVLILLITLIVLGARIGFSSPNP